MNTKDIRKDMMKSPEFRKEYNKKHMCIRCGMFKHEIKKTGRGCSVFGEKYKKHSYK